MCCPSASPRPRRERAGAGAEWPKAKRTGARCAVEGVGRPFPAPFCPGAGGSPRFDGGRTDGLSFFFAARGGAVIVERRGGETRTAVGASPIAPRAQPCKTERMALRRPLCFLQPRRAARMAGPAGLFCDKRRTLAPRRPSVAPYMNNSRLTAITAMPPMRP